MRKLIVFAVFALLLGSCSNEETISSSPKKGELSVLATIATTQKTRALMNTFGEGDQIGIFVTGSTYTVKAAKYTLTSSNWTPPTLGTDKIELGVDEATVYGYYPATLEPTTYFSNQANNLVNITMPTDITGLIGEGQQDCMYSTHPKVTSLNPSSSLVFSHALCKLSFVVNAGWGYADSKTISGLIVKKDASFKCGTGTMNLSDGTIAWGDLSSTTQTFSFSGSATMNDYNATTPSSTTVLQCLVPPNADNSDVSITLTINGAQKTVKLPMLNGADKWTAGNNYKYTVTVYGSSLSIDPAHIADWVNEDLPDSDLKLNQ